MLVVDVFPVHLYRIRQDGVPVHPLQINTLVGEDRVHFLNDVVGVAATNIIWVEWQELAIITDFHLESLTVRNVGAAGMAGLGVAVFAATFRRQNAHANDYDQQILVRRGAEIQLQGVNWRLILLVVAEGEMYLYYKTHGLAVPTTLRLTVEATTPLTTGASYYDPQEITVD
jgi:hypothetical protein